jgi:hypothetical protein
VTSVQCTPPSVVVWIVPSSAPVQMRPVALGDRARAVRLPMGAGVTVLAYLPALAGTDHRWRVRSGLMRVQLWAWSVLFQTTLDV